MNLEDNLLDALSESASDHDCASAGEDVAEAALEDLGSQAGSDEVLEGVLQGLSDAEASEEGPPLDVEPLDVEHEDRICVLHQPAAVGIRSDQQGDASHSEVLPQFLTAAENLLVLAWKSRIANDEQLSMPYARIAASLVSPDHSVLRTDSAEAEKLDFDRKQLREIRLAISSACVRLEMQAWRHFEQRIVSLGCTKPNFQLLLYMEIQAFDGVDMSLLTKGRFKHIMPGAIQDSDGDPVVALDALAIVPDKPDDKQVCHVGDGVWSNDGVSKILQTSSSVLIAFKCGDQCHIVHGSRLNWLQCSDRTTAEAIKAMLEKQSIRTDEAEQFPRKVRHTTSDRYAANGLAEDTLVSLREGWAGFKSGCHAHMAASCHGLVVELTGRHRQGITHVCKALQAAGQMDLFRKSFFCTLSDMLVIVPRIDLSPEAVGYKNLVLDVFVGQAKELHNLRSTCLTCCPGDWRDTSKLEFAAPAGTTKQEVMTLLKRFFGTLVVGHCPFLCSQNKWTGSEQTYRDLGLPLCIHGLFYQAFRHYLAVNHKSSTSQASAGGGQAVPEALPILDVDAPTPNQSVAEPSANETASAAENRQHRRCAQIWLDSSPTPLLLWVTMVTAPARRYLLEEFRMGSELYAAKEWSKATSATTPDGLRGMLEGREWPLLVAAKGSLDQKVMADVVALHDVANFRFFPENSRTLNFQHLQFKMLSKQGAYLTELMIVPHMLPPYSLLNICLEPDAAEDIGELCESIMDPYTKNFVKYFSVEGRGLTSFEALLELTLIIVTGRTNIINIESLNGFLRRIMAARYQTNVMRLVTLSSHFVLARLRSRRKLQLAPAGLRVKKKRKTRRDANKRARKTNKRRPGGGGAWRVFVRKRGMELKRAFQKEISQEYASLSPEEFTPLAEEGRLGTLARRAGGKAFGPSTRELARLIQKDSVTRRCKALVNFARAPICDSETVVGTPLDEKADALKQMHADCALLKRMGRQTDHDDAQALKAWAESTGVQMRDKFVAVDPGFGANATAFQGQPVGSTSFVTWTCPINETIDRLVGLLKTPENSKIVDELLQWWDEAHEITYHAEQEKIPGKRSSMKPSCADAKTCICGARGAAIMAAKKAVVDHLRAHCTESDHLKSLLSGDIVLKLCGVNVYDPSDETACQMFPESYVHISLMYLKPYRPTFRVLQLRHVDDLGHLHMYALNTFQPLYIHLSQQIADEKPVAWKMTLYKLHNSSRPLAELNPRHVILESFVPEVVKVLRVPKQPSQAADCAEAALAALSDSDEDQQDVVSSDHAMPGSDCDMREVDVDPLENTEIENPFMEDPCPGMDVDVDGLETAMDLAMGDTLYSPASPVPEEVAALHGDPPADPAGESISSSSSSSSLFSSSSDDKKEKAAAAAPEPLAASSSSLPAPSAKPLPTNCLAEIRTPCGKLTLYKNYDVVAHCTNTGEHGPKCRLTRNCRIDNPSRPAKGRSIGLHYAWLKCSGSSKWPDHNAHVRSCKPDYAARCEARNDLYSLPGGKAFADMAERERRSGESEEPLDLP